MRLDHRGVPREARKGAAFLFGRARPTRGRIGFGISHET